MADSGGGRETPGLETRGADDGSVVGVHDDDELAAAIAAQILSFTSTVPLPIIRPLDDPRLQFGGALSAESDVDAAPRSRETASPTRDTAPAPAPAPVPVPVPAPAAAPAAPAAPVVPEPEPVATEPEPEPVATEPAPEPVATEPAPEPVAAEVRPVAAEPRTVPAPPVSGDEAGTTPVLREPPRTEPISTVRARSSAVDDALRQMTLDEALAATGPIVLPPRVYADWERELRSIGRPDGSVPSTIAEPGPPAAAPAPAAPPELPERANASDAIRSFAVPAELAPPVAADPPPEPEPPSEPTDADPVNPGPAPAVVTEVAVVETADAAPDTADAASAPQHLGVLRAVDRSDWQTGEVAPVADPDEPDMADDVVDRPLAGPVLATVGAASLVVSPLTILLGFSLGIAGVASPIELVGAMAVGALLGLPGVVRAAARAHRGDGVVALARRVLGTRPGTVLVAVLLLARIAALVVVLLALAALATAFADRTGVLGTQSDALTAVIAVSAAGVVGVLAALFRARTVSVIVAALGVLSVLFTALVVGLIASGGAAGSAGGPGDRAAIGAGAAVLAVLALSVGGGGMRLRTPASRSVPTRASTAGRAVGVLVASLLGAAALLIAILLASGGTGAASQAPADALIGAIVDATAPQFALPLGIAALVSAAIVVAVLTRSAGDLLAELLTAPRSAGLAGGGAALVAMAVTLGLLATNVSASGFDAAGVVAHIGPVFLVPLVAWLGLLATAPAREQAVGTRVPARWISIVGLLVATAAGLLLVDGLIVPDETSPILRLVTVPAVWRDTQVAGLAVAIVLGLLTGALATVAPPSAARAPKRTVGVPDKVAA